VLINKCYGLEILKAREIIGLVDITAVPQTPRNLKVGSGNAGTSNAHLGVRQS